MSYISGLCQARGIDVRKNFGSFGDRSNMRSEGKKIAVLLRFPLNCIGDGVIY